MSHLRLLPAVPILTGRAVTSARLGRWLFGLWNFAVMLPGWILVLAGFGQPLEWAEFPIGVDVFVVIGLALASVQGLQESVHRTVVELTESRAALVRQRAGSLPRR